MIFFEIYDDGNLIFKGKGKDVSYQFNIAENTLYNYYCYGHKIGKRYDVKKVHVEPIKEVKEPKRKLTKHEETINYIVWHLNQYGNVYVNHDPTPYLKELKELGYDCKIDEYKTLDDIDIIISEENTVNRRKKRHYATDYVLTMR